LFSIDGTCAIESFEWGDPSRESLSTTKRKKKKKRKILDEGEKVQLVGMSPTRDGATWKNGGPAVPLHRRRRRSQFLKTD